MHLSHLLWIDAQLQQWLTSKCSCNLHKKKKKKFFSIFSLQGLSPAHGHTSNNKYKKQNFTYHKNTSLA